MIGADLIGADPVWSLYGKESEKELQIKKYTK